MGKMQMLPETGLWSPCKIEFKNGPQKSTGALRVYLENKKSEKDKSTSWRVGHGQTQRGNNKEPLLCKQDKYLLSGVRIQREQVEFFYFGLPQPSRWAGGFLAIFGLF